MRASRSLIPPLSTTQPPWRLCKQNGDGVSKDEDGTSRNELCMVERGLDNFALLLRVALHSSGKRSRRERFPDGRVPSLLSHVLRSWRRIEERGREAAMLINAST